MKSFWLCFPVLCCVVFSVGAADIFVPDDYATIQAAVDAAENSDTVWLRDGTYTGAGNFNIYIKEKSLTIRSVSGAAAVLIDCQQQGYGVMFDYWDGPPMNCVIQGISFVNARNENQWGGGIHAVKCNLLVKECVFRDGYAEIGGGIHFHYAGQSRVEGCIFTGNGAERCGGAISAVYSHDDSMIEVDGCQFDSNSSSRSGGAIDDFDKGFVISNSVFRNNTCRGKVDSSGGAVSFAGADEYPNSEIVHCVFYGNECDHFGGAVYSVQDISVRGCEFSDNAADEFGGSVYLLVSDSEVSDSVFTGNTAGLRGGVGYFDAYYSSAGVSFTNCLFVDNDAGMGGVFHAKDYQVTCINATVVNPDAVIGEIMSGVRSYGIFKSCICWGGMGDSLFTSIEATGYQVEHSDIQGGFAGTGNMNADPLFLDGPAGPYYLSQVDAGQAVDSPCLNAGHAAASSVCFTSAQGIPVCLDEFTTRMDGGLDTAVVDMGYHYSPQLPTPTPTPYFPATPTPGTTDFEVDLNLSEEIFAPGERFYLTATLRNDTGEPIQGDPLVIVLEVFGQYYFHPVWTEEFSYEPVSMDSGDITLNILDFTWPVVSGPVTGVAFYGALLTPDFQQIHGAWDFVTFGWE